MTDEWFDGLFNKTGQDMWQARIDRLLFEFRCLGGKNAKSEQRGECGERDRSDGEREHF